MEYLLVDCIGKEELLLMYVNRLNMFSYVEKYEMSII